jgi:hypothetical protein
MANRTFQVHEIELFNPGDQVHMVNGRVLLGSDVEFKIVVEKQKNNHFAITIVSHNSIGPYSIRNVFISNDGGQLKLGKQTTITVTAENVKGDGGPKDTATK